ncbi:6-phospho-beta-glucosidase [Pilibacter termitis]|uniref:6-phospho-beta-glucosidase n=1 Tax=Pilibacter termitis TaxID=263852 RepID=A0A1T4L0R2_9ENTE|nr:glycoside hydrolase family 1 protein [Pilibacter termitis]SJZ48314.1 6-phospho-beta-glucosidase [Pilibacter termitis]
MPKLTFPENFWWGAATSGPQSEGRFHKKHANMFDYFYEIKPEVFYKHQGPDTASNFYNDYKEDIRLMKSAGLKVVRTSIQWSRLIDDLEKNTVNDEAVKFYNAVIDEFLAQGITPMMNLHHFDLPVELYHKYGGWESKYVVDLYAGFAEQCFKLFGDRVKFWFTHNEPLVVVEGEYLFEFHYPQKVDGLAAVQVAYNLQLASSKAIASYRSLNLDGKIGVILNLTPPYPATDEKEDVRASEIADLWLNRLYMDASVKGEFPQELVEILEGEQALWQATEEELAIIKNNTVDLLGINFYHPNRVERPKYSPNSLAVDFMPDKFWRDYEKASVRMNVDKGWEIYPRAVYDIAKDIQENYGNIDWFMSENGMGVSNEERYMNASGVIEDDYRIQFIKEHLYWLHQAMEEGSNCLGYHLWTPIDCWSWMNAYRNRYGLISTNIHTQEKTLKKSAHWFKQLSDTNAFELEKIPD